ncbi:hypothetical protein SLA2020_291590 [Shorea laevis]
MLGAEEYSQVFAESYSSINEITTTKTKKNKNKRRFSDEQIRSLELMFENESTLEPRKKLRLAKELGLQPRQVAIWFQNKRARWKSKQLERDYSILEANYNSLTSQFEILKKEKQALLIQMQKMKDMLQRPKEESQHSGECVAINSIDNESENGETARCKSNVQPSISMERSEDVLGVLSDDDSAMKADYFGLEGEPILTNMVEPADGGLTSTEDWGSFETDNLFEQSCSSYLWWDFWC